MAQQHYDVPGPDQPGQFVKRHWQPLDAPVLDAQGQVVQLLHSVLDVTAEVQAQAHLRESQDAEQAAHTKVQRQRFYELLMQLPAQVAVHEGPAHVFTLVNPGYQRLAPGRSLLGQPIREAWPELVSQGILDVLDQVYCTGEPFIGTELPFQVDFSRTGRLEQVYLNAFFLPLRDAQNQLHGVLDFSYDVTEQVRARRQLEQLNQEPEARAQVRAQELAQAQAETDTQRLGLHQLVAEAPALIASLRGPAHVVELANDGFRAIFGGRELVGKPYREAIPEFDGQPFFDRLDRVYRTGETYYGIDELVILDRTNSGQLERTFITYTYQATRDAQGQIDGILVFCYEVTEQVLARQEREAQQQRLHALFMQAPAPIVILDGPELVFQLVNPAYQLIFPGRTLLGRPILQALPELADSPIPAILQGIWETGETYVAQELPLRLARHEGGPLEQLYWTFTY